MLTGLKWGIVNEDLGIGRRKILKTDVTEICVEIVNWIDLS